MFNLHYTSFVPKVKGPGKGPGKDSVPARTRKTYREMVESTWRAVTGIDAANGPKVRMNKRDPSKAGPVVIHFFFGLPFASLRFSATRNRTILLTSSPGSGSL